MMKEFTKKHPRIKKFLDFVQKMRKKKYTFWHGLLLGITLWGFYTIMPTGTFDVAAESNAVVGITEVTATEQLFASRSSMNLHFVRIEEQGGQLTIVPYTTLFDVALIYPLEGEPFEVETVPEHLGTNWLHYDGETWAYSNILGLKPGIEYKRELLRSEDGDVIGFRFYSEDGDQQVTAYEWIHSDYK